MSGYLIDTDWVIDVLPGNETAQRPPLDLVPEGLAISIITYGELCEGAHHARNAGNALNGLHDFLLDKDELPLTVNIMERFAVVRGQLPRSVRHQVGDMDLLIAATALQHDLVLVARNLRDFRLIPGVIIFEDPESVQK